MSTSKENGEVKDKDGKTTFPEIDNKVFRQIGIREGKEHLSNGSFSSPYFPAIGTVNGPNRFLYIYLACKRFDKTDAPVFNVWFVFDTGSSDTYINEETMKALYGSDDIPVPMNLAIQDPNYSIECYPSYGHFKGHFLKDYFKDANALGVRAMLELGVTVADMNREKQSFRFIKMED